MGKIGLAVGLGLCLIAAVAWAAPRWVPRPSLGAADRYVTTGSTVMYDASIYIVGGAVGNKVELRNGGPTGAVFHTFVAATANAMENFIPLKPLVVDGGIYIDSTLTSGGSGAYITYQE